MLQTAFIRFIFSYIDTMAIDIRTVRKLFGRNDVKTMMIYTHYARSRIGWRVQSGWMGF